MFTGIITAIGTIAEARALGDTPAHGLRLEIVTPEGYLDDVTLGDSIALNGACMTVTTMDTQAHRFEVDLSVESLSRTTGLDRPGLLFELTATLSRLNLNIGSAHVATFGERVVDVFYVTDLFGAKITAPTRQATIKRALIGLLSPAHEPDLKPAKSAAAG